MARTVTISAGVVAMLAVVSYLFIDRPIAMATHESGLVNSGYVQVLTRFGDSMWYLPVFALLFVVFLCVGRRLWAQRCLLVFLSIMVSGIAANVIKFTLARWRPLPLVNDGHYGFEFFTAGYYDRASFPSGHACTIAALCTALYLFFPRWKYVWLVLAVCVGGMRVLSLSHFPSDVLVGLYLGAFSTFWLERRFAQRGATLRSPDAKLLPPLPEADGC